MLREIVLFYPEVKRILYVEMIKSCKSSQRTEPSLVLLFLPPKAKQDIHPAIKWFSNHFIKKQY